MRRTEWPFLNQGQMDSHIKLSTLLDDCRCVAKGFTAGDYRRAGNNSLRVRDIDPAVDLLMKPHVVRVYNQKALHGYSVAYIKVC
jgi:hypothetical protein